MGLNGKSRQYDVAVVSAVESPCRTEYEIETEFFGNKARLVVLAFAPFHAYNFLKGNDIGVDSRQHLDDAAGTDAPIETSTLMNIVGCDAKLAGSHSGTLIIARSTPTRWPPFIEEIDEGFEPELSNHLCFDTQHHPDPSNAKNEIGEPGGNHW